MLDLARRRALLTAALGFTVLDPRERELRLLHAWLDTWRGVGDVVSGMKRQGYEVSLGDHGSGHWIAVFYAGHGGYQPLEAAGTAQAPAPWAAVQRAAWAARARGERASGNNRSSCPSTGWSCSSARCE